MATIARPHVWIVVYRLHVRSADGTVQTVDYATPLLRGRRLIALKRQPVDLKCEDVAVRA
jgi:hypothetical protein